MKKKKKPIHKFNGGLGATLCNNCRVIINTGMTDDIYCKDCADNKVTYHNRYRDKIIFEHNGDEVIMTGGSWMRYGIADDNETITMVDPSGGPYIELGNNLNEFWPKGEYQDLIVESISLNNGEGETTTVIFKVKTNGNKPIKRAKRKHPQPETKSKEELDDQEG